MLVLYSYVGASAGVTQEKGQHRICFLRLPFAMLAFFIFIAKQVGPSLSLVDSSIEFCPFTKKSLSTTKCDVRKKTVHRKSSLGPSCQKVKVATFRQLSNGVACKCGKLLHCLSTSPRRFPSKILRVADSRLLWYSWCKYEQGETAGGLVRAGELYLG